MEPFSNETKMYKVQFTSSLQASLIQTPLGIKHLVLLILEYSRVGSVQIHDARHLIIPPDISSSTEDDEAKDEIDNESHDEAHVLLCKKSKRLEFKCFSIMQLPATICSFLLHTKRQFGDVVLFKNNYAFVGGDTTTIWIIPEREKDGQKYDIWIPLKITQDKPDAAYFYDIPQNLIYSNNVIEWMQINLPYNDHWLQKKLKMPKSQKEVDSHSQLLKLPKNVSINYQDWKYKIIMSDTYLGCVPGDVFITNESGIDKSFNLTQTNVWKHIQTYFGFVSQPKITFRVRYKISNLDGASHDQMMLAHLRPTNHSTKNGNRDLLPLCWDRKLIGANSYGSECDFTAPKSQITQTNINNIKSYIPPSIGYLAQMYNKSDTVVVVVKIVLIYTRGEGGWNHDEFGKSRKMFDSTIEQIFGNYFEGDWSQSMFGSTEERSKYIKEPLWRGREEGYVFWGPKNQLDDKIRQLNQFMGSKQYKTMQPWYKINRIIVEDPLAEIDGLVY